MAHLQQITFCTSIKTQFPSFFKDKIVLDIGSLDINGNNQYLFEDCLYLGIDLNLGKNVDFAVKGHELQLPDESIDVIISTECFEHDQFYDLTLKNILRMLKPGGLLLFTCATTGRPEHGTRRTTVADAPFLEKLGDWGDYYKNLEEKDIREVINIGDNFNNYKFSNNQETFDLYFWGIKKGCLVERQDYSFLLAQKNLKDNLVKIEKSIAAQGNQIKTLSETFLNQNEHFIFMKKNLFDQDEKISLLQRDIAYKNENIQALNISLTEKEQSITILNKTIQDYQTLTSNLHNRNNELESTIIQLYSSNSWKITSPLRRTSSLKLVQKIKNNQKKMIKLINFTLNHKAVVVNQFKMLYSNYGLWTTTQRMLGFIQRGGPRPISIIPSKSEHQLILENELRNPIVILTPKHCYYIAYSIKLALERINIESEIIYQRPDNGFSDVPHFVICPQIFSVLPGFYIAIQMEQSVSSRWFTPEYIKTLENSFAILDYSINNIKYLQEQGLHWKQIYYLPIGYTPNYQPFDDNDSVSIEEYDVLFYGDTNNDRRKKYLEAISSQFKVKIISDTFGKNLYMALKKAKLVINIHYYKGALLETTRIWECLSLNKLVVSEYSSDMEENTDILDLVDFVEVDNIDAMIDRISFWLRDDKIRHEKITQNKQKLEKSYFNRFNYFFYRFLLANNNIKYDTFWNLIGKNYKLNCDKVCLTLPETPIRTNEFQKENKYGFEVFYGLRHQQGWIGCAISYKFLAMLALKENLPYLTVCEDDVVFPENMYTYIEDIICLLLANPNYDVFSGLLADLHENTKIINTYHYKNKKYAVINRFISTVFNIYRKNILELMASWDEKNHDIENNTIDRYIEKNLHLNVLTTIPFLVGHKEDQKSVLWGFQNTQYNELIRKSEQLLISKTNNAE